MARDIEAEVKVKDSSKPGLDSVERNFKRTGKNIEKEYERFGKSTGDKLIASIGAVSPRMARRVAAMFGEGATIGAPLLISGIAGTLPGLSALIGAAVTGGAAGAGIIGGVALAARDPRVKAAGTQLGQIVLQGLTDRSKSFVQPVLNSLNIMKRQFVDSGVTIERLFTNASKFVEPLAASLADVGESLIDGLDIAVGRAGPVMQALNDGIRGTGDAVESMLDSLSRNAEGNAAILQQTFSSLNATIEGVGYTLYGLSEVFEFLNSIMPLSLFENMKQVLIELGVIGANQSQWIEPTANDLRTIATEEQAAAAATREHERAMREEARAAQEAINAHRSLFDDTTRLGEATRAAKKAAEENGRTLSANTEKGRANRQALSNLASAMVGYRENLIKSGAATSQVNRVQEQQRTALLKVATQMTGNKARARELVDQLLKIPPKRETKTDLLNDAKVKKEAREVQAALNNIDRTINVTVNIARRITGSALSNSALAAAVRKNYAAGGSFALVEGGTVRTGGPVQVESTVENVIYLDGRPFRDFISRTVAEVDSRIQHRQRYGGRHT